MLFLRLSCNEMAIKFYKNIVNFRESQLKLMYRSFRCLFTFRCHFLRSKMQLKF